MQKTITNNTNIDVVKLVLSADFDDMILALENASRLVDLASDFPAGFLEAFEKVVISLYESLEFFVIDAESAGATATGNVEVGLGLKFPDCYRGFVSALRTWEIDDPIVGHGVLLSEAILK